MLEMEVYITEKIYLRASMLRLNSQHGLAHLHKAKQLLPGLDLPYFSPQLFESAVIVTWIRKVGLAYTRKQEK